MIRPEVVQQLACPAVGLSTSWIISRHGIPAGALNEIQSQFRREFWPFAKSRPKKNDTLAKQLREKANECYRKEPAEVEKVLRLYNESISSASKESEDLGLGYANRSAVYLNQKNYTKCLSNIELAKTNHYPESKIEKLLEREKKCLDMLNEIKPECGMKDLYDCYNVNLQLAEIPQCGRGLTTKKDLNVGDIILTEKPCVLALEPEAIYSRCSHCGCKNELDLIPCGTCSASMYCSKQCRDEAFTKYHKFECEIIEDLKYLFQGPKTTRMFSLSLRLFWMIVSNLIENPDQFRSRYPEEMHEFRNPLETAHSDMHLHVLSDDLPDMASDQTGKGVTQFLTVLIYKIAVEENTSIGSLLQDEDKTLLLEILYGLILRSKNICDQSVADMTCFYPLLRMVNHSCAPNAERILKGEQSVLITKRPIKAGEQIMMCYLPGSTTDTKEKEKRKTYLQKEFGFDCLCLGCSLDYPMLSAVPANDELIDELAEIVPTGGNEKLQLLGNFLQRHDNRYPQKELAEAWKLYRDEWLKQ